MIKDGYIYGRGAIDDKGMLAANLAAFIALKRSNARLNRDVIFLATASEEGAAKPASEMLISKYWDKFAAEYAINEGGNVFVKNGKVQYVAVQASEKVALNVTVIAKGTSGHASIPLKDNAVTHLARRWKRSATIPRRCISPPSCGDISKGSRRCRTMKSRKWMRSLDTAGPRASTRSE